MRFSFIAEMEQANKRKPREQWFSIAFMCRMLGVSRQGFYQWRDRPPSRRALDDAMLTERIKKIHAGHGRRVGVRRVRDELARAGVICSHKRVHRLMRAAGLRGVHPRPYKRTTLPGRFDPNLVDLLRRDFAPTAPDRVWVGDITYIKTWSGWAFLATVIDCHSRRLVGFAVAEHMRTDLVIDALRMAITHRNPPPGVIFHSDRGAQYTSEEFRRFCKANGVDAHIRHGLTKVRRATVMTTVMTADDPDLLTGWIDR